MNYLDDIARRIRDRIPDSALPDGDTTELFRAYAVLALARGSRVRLSDIHNAWVAWMLDQRPEHRAFKPFDELPPDIQGLDRPFAEAVREVAAELGLDGSIAEGDPDR